MTQQRQECDWLELYRSALLELDYSVLPGRILQADTAIQARLTTLESQGDGSEEFWKLKDAQANLRVLENELKAESASIQSHFHAELEGKYVVMVDLNRKYVAFTDEVCDLLGYSRDELLSKTIDDVTPPEIRDEVSAKFQQYLTDRGMAGEYVLMARDGQRVPIHYESKVFPDGCMVARWSPQKAGAA